MKRLFVFCIVILGWLMPVVEAQTIGLEQLNQYAKQQYKSQWKNAAMSICPVLPLDERGGYTYATTIAYPGLSAVEVFDTIRTKLSAVLSIDTVLQSDPEQGVLRVRTYLYSVSSQVGGFYRFHLCLHPVITVRATANEAQVEIALQYYEIVKTDKGLVSSLFQRGESTPLPAEQWLLADRYPYNERGKMPLATAEAFTKSYALIQLLIEQLKR